VENEKSLLTHNLKESQSAFYKYKPDLENVASRILYKLESHIRSLNILVGTQTSKVVSGHKICFIF